MKIVADQFPINVGYRTAGKNYNSTIPAGEGDNVPPTFDQVTVQPGEEFAVVGEVVFAREVTPAASLDPIQGAEGA